jgi:hypothetical protein
MSTQGSRCPFGRFLDVSRAVARLFAAPAIALGCLLYAGFSVTGCAAGPRPQLTDPDVSVRVMRDAFEKDDVALFLHTLSRPVLREYNEHLIRVGWSDIRPRVGEFVEDARVVEVEDVHALPVDPSASRSYVWPVESARLRRVRITVGDVHEDFLFTLEVDAPPPAARQARGFWVGDGYYVRTEHPSPQTYLTEDSPESERTHWRLVFPYHPYQHNGRLSARLQAQLAQE